MLADLDPDLVNVDVIVDPVVDGDGDGDVNAASAAPPPTRPIPPLAPPIPREALRRGDSQEGRKVGRG